MANQEALNLDIRKATLSDLPLLLDISSQMHNAKDADYFKTSLQLQALEEREIYLMEDNQKVVGYVQLSWHPKYAYFRVHNIPEIQDLNILPDYRCKGLGQALIEFCEAKAKKRLCEYMGIGVGLTAPYGSAQRLYARLGYVPDGFGVTYDRQTVGHGEIRSMDDELSLMLVKKL